MLLLLSFSVLLDILHFTWAFCPFRITLLTVWHIVRMVWVPHCHPCYIASNYVHAVRLVLLLVTLHRCRLLADCLRGQCIRHSLGEYVSIAITFAAYQLLNGINTSVFLRLLFESQFQQLRKRLRYLRQLETFEVHWINQILNVTPILVCPRVLAVANSPYT